MRQKRDSLLFRFSVIYIALILLLLLVMGAVTYFSQMRIYKVQCEKNIRCVSEYLTQMMQAESEDLIEYQNYYMEHYDEMKISYDFHDFTKAAEEFEADFVKQYPGKVFRRDIKPSELTGQAQLSYYCFRHEYWMQTFEEARDSFDLPYAYYLVMDDKRARKTEYEDHNVTYMIDAERTKTIGEDGKEYLFLGDTYHYSPDKYAIMWKTWENGQKQNGYMEWNNEWGHTYGYYTPLIVNGKKLGLVAAEINVSTINQAILGQTLQQIAIIMTVLIAGSVVLFFFLKHAFLDRISMLEKEVKHYYENKDVSMVDEFQQKFAGKDEISTLGQEFGSMILHQNAYIITLQETTKALKRSRQLEQEMRALANKDSLTGAKSKTAYDIEAEKISEEMKNGEAEFGIVMIDLNYLKMINDTYGHEKGNIAICRLFELVCLTFSHSPVYRIGGDEFAVILRKRDYANAEALVQFFRDSINANKKNHALKPWEAVSAAIGYAIYDKNTDIDFESVFKRADEAMYEDKRSSYCSASDQPFVTGTAKR